MKNNFLKVAGIGLATTIALAIQSSAQAYDFSFDNFQADTQSASGTFTINDSTPQGVIDASDFEDWEITTKNQAGDTNVIYGPGNALHNSDFFDFNGAFKLTSIASFDSNSLVFLENWAIGDPIGGGFNNTVLYQTDSTGGNAVRVNSIQTNDISVQNISPFPYLTATNSSPTAVPFGVSPDLGILILGGLCGASRLRKTLAARKQIGNQEA